MIRIYVPTLAVSLMCAMAFATAPAIAYEFYGNTSTPQVHGYGTSPEQAFQLGASDALTCREIYVEYTPGTGHSPTLPLKITHYGNCKYVHSGTSEPASTTASCEYILKSTGLVETPSDHFSGGGIDFECKIMGFETAHCGVDIIGPSALSEFKWEDIPATYESYLFFNVVGITYEIHGTSCGASGTNGKYTGPVPMDHVTVR